MADGCPGDAGGAGRPIPEAPPGCHIVGMSEGEQEEEGGPDPWSDADADDWRFGGPGG